MCGMKIYEMYLDQLHSLKGLLQLETMYSRSKVDHLEIKKRIMIMYLETLIDLVSSRIASIGKANEQVLKERLVSIEDYYKTETLLGDIKIDLLKMLEEEGYL